MNIMQRRSVELLDSDRKLELVRRRVEIVVVRDNKVLVGRYLRRTTGDTFYSLPGGGIEIGETPEQAVHRELLEEMGVVVKNVRDLNLVMNFPPPYFISNYRYDKIVTEWYSASYTKEDLSSFNSARDGSIEKLWLNKKTALEYINDSLYARGSIRAIERVLR
jgi:8-oxo-dGTP pyrophosphatase MutT (NUDIX family)